MSSANGDRAASDLLQQGFALPYAADKGNFRFYVMAVAAVLLITAYILAGGHAILLVLGVGAGCVAYYFYPLIERKPRFGANQYGIFIDGLGVIAWRAVDDIVLRTYAVRTLENKELHIRLNRDLDRALMVDWRRLPIYRLLMRLPWSMTHDNVIRIKLEPFGPEPGQIHRAITRIWNFYR